MKVFISQPMKGYTEEMILTIRNELINYAKGKYGEDVEIIDSFFKSVTDKDFCDKHEELPHPLELLGESIKLLSKADVAIFAPNFRNARGCKIEYNCCLNYNIQVDTPLSINCEEDLFFSSEFR